VPNAASIVEYTVKPENAEELTAAVRDHLIPAAQKVPGYLGFLLFDRGENKRMAVLLFDSPAGVRTAQEVLSPIGEEHTYHLMSSGAIGSLGLLLAEDGILGG
jgi:hypothetical protein